MDCTDRVKVFYEGKAIFVTIILGEIDAFSQITIRCNPLCNGF